jgi:hypothetical protein
LATFVVSTTADSGPGSLRQAILNANASSGTLDTIAFALPATDGGHVYYQDDGVAGMVSTNRIAPTTQSTDAALGDIDPDWPHSWWRIQPISSLPALTDPVEIDGMTQDGAVANSHGVDFGLNGVLRVQLDGSQAGVITDGLTLAAGSGGSTVRGLAIGLYRRHGIVVASSGNTIEGSYIGVDVSGSVDRGNLDRGLQIVGNNNRIGGVLPEQRNIVSANSHGIVFEPGAGNRVEGNLIGTDVSGVRSLGNDNNGIMSLRGANSMIGGTTDGSRNLISGNGTNGVTLVFPESSGTVIQGNRVGTDITGTQPLGNLFFGLFSFQATMTIGGTEPGAGNLISANRQHGISFDGNARNSVIQGNLIGTDRTGTLPLGNGMAGIRAFDSTDVTIGGPEPGAGNVIAASGTWGIESFTGAKIEGNWIGTDITQSIDLGNGTAIFHRGNLATSRSNTITNNSDGVRLFDFNSSGNLISQNEIYKNDQSLDIDLLGPGALGVNFPQDAGDADTGANGLQNFPIIESVVQVGGGVQIGGTFDSQRNGDYRLEFFSSSQPGSSGFGGGETYLGDLVVHIGATSSEIEFSVELPVLPADQPYLTATATDITVVGDRPRNNTSEFSPAVPLDTILTVTNTADSGAGSLRATIAAADFLGGRNSISFAIPPSDPGHVYYRDDGVVGQVSTDHISATTEASDAAIADIDPDWPHSWYAINLQAPLKVAESVVVDGYTQPGSQENSNPVGLGLNSILRVELNGREAGELPALSAILQIDAGESTIRGLAVNRAGGQQLQLQSGSNSRLEGNYFGTDVSGTLKFPLGLNSFVPVFAGVSTGTSFGDASSHHTIGGTTPAARNLISGNKAGIALLEDANDYLIQGNLIGTDRSGSRPLGNQVGVFVSAENTVVGGVDAQAKNVISGNTSYGVELDFFGGHSVVEGNWIGTDATGQLPLGNGSRGVRVVGSLNNQILGNVIAHNGDSTIGHGGIAINGTGNLVSQNAIYGNFGMGLDLGQQGVNQNDLAADGAPHDNDTGANLLQNFPIITGADTTGALTELSGILQSTPNSEFRIEVFGNRERDEGIFDFEGPARAGEYSEGEGYLGSVDVTTDGAGEATFQFSIPAVAVDIGYLTATATNITDDGAGPLNNTSEFSPVFPLGGPSTVVTRTADAGIGTLREALTVANLRAGDDHVTFNISANDPGHLYYRDDGVAGQVSPNRISVTDRPIDADIADIDPDWPHSWFSIQPTRWLPDITERLGIDGYSQPGAVPNSSPAPGALNSVLKIELNGSQVNDFGLFDRYDGLRVMFGGELTIIEGLAINQFVGNGIRLRTTGGNRVYGNYLGTDISGSLPLGNAQSGLLIDGDAVNRVGGLEPSTRNLISGNGEHGIEQRNSGGDVYQGNLIGSDRSGTVLLENGDAAIQLDRAFFVTVGGTEPQAGNLVASRSADGIRVYDSRYPELDLPETDIADFLSCSDFARDVFRYRDQFFASNDLADAEAMQFAFLAVFLCGLQLGETEFYPQANIFLGNSLTTLGAQPTDADAIGIDLGDDGVTVNDLGDNDGGPNNLRNAPTILHAVTRQGQTVITGSYVGTPDTIFRLEFFSSGSQLPARHGTAESFLAAAVVTTDAQGKASYRVELPEVVPVGQYVTGTATYLFDLRDDGSELVALETSELARNVVVGPAVPGDANLDGNVDGIDLDIWMTHRFTTGNNWGTADFNADGVTDGADFQLWNAFKFTTSGQQLQAPLSVGRSAVRAPSSLGRVEPKRWEGQPIVVAGQARRGLSLARTLSGRGRGGCAGHPPLGGSSLSEGRDNRLS